MTQEHHASWGERGTYVWKDGETKAKAHADCASKVATKNTRVGIRALEAIGHESRKLLLNAASFWGAFQMGFSG